MKKILFICTCIFASLLCTACFRNDTRIGIYHVPNMTSQECLNALSGRLRAVEGVMDVQADFATQQVSVTFNGLKAGLKNIEFVIAGAGFDVNDTPGAAAAKAALPVSCR
jgi:copper chaperone CopZ